MSDTRLVCEDLLRQIPEEGLQEAAEELARIWCFYKTPRKPSGPGVVIREVSAVAGEKHVRPEFRFHAENNPR